MTGTAAGTARHAAKRVAARTPRSLLRNRGFHAIQRHRGYRDVEVRPELTDRPDILERLVEDGVALIPNFLDPSEAVRLLEAVEVVLEEARSGARPDDTFSLYPDVLLRLAHADRLVPETAVFFDDPSIEGVARAATAPRALSHRRELEIRFGQNRMNQADLYHFDNWRPIVKAFLYLTDVGEENAPFVYLRGSHKPGKWRWRHEVTFDVDGPNGRFGFFFPQETRRLIADHGWEDLVCTGRAGTLVLADLRGLHRGTPLRAGRRVLLNNTFDTMNSSPA